MGPQIDDAADLLSEARAPNTREAYESDWRVFEAWCGDHNLDPSVATPAEVVLYLTQRHRERAAPNTLKRAYCGIAFVLRRMNAPAWPTGRRPDVINECLKAISRTSDHVLGRKKAITADQIALVDFGVDLVGIRNRAMMMLCIAAGSRRSEIVALDRADVARGARGVTLFIEKSKRDQERKGRLVGIVREKDPEVCPVRALGRWWRATRDQGVTRGPLFCAVEDGRATGERLDPRVIAEIAKTIAEACGLDPTEYAGHSLRSGFVTTAALNGVPLDAIMRQTGHVRVDQVLEYIRIANVFDNNASDGIFSRSLSRRHRDRR